MSCKNRAWKYATAFVVLLVALNPEMVQLALFIDAIGLEMFLMLLEVQLTAVLGMFFRSEIRSVYARVKCLLLRCFPINSWAGVIKHPESLVLAVSGPAVLMNTLVISVLTGILFNRC